MTLNKWTVLEDLLYPKGHYSATGFRWRGRGVELAGAGLGHTKAVDLAVGSKQVKLSNSKFKSLTSHEKHILNKNTSINISDF